MKKVEDIFRNEILTNLILLKFPVENQNIQDLKNELSSYVEQLKASENNVVITNQRHFEALQKSLDAV
jgi:tRNA modification GTPase